MLYRFKLVSDEASGFYREIEIDPDATFLDLRDAVLDSVGYSKDDLSSFFICDDDWNKETEVTLEDMGSDSDKDIYLMADTPLSELLEDEGQKLIFVFDYLNERLFFMEMREIVVGRSLDAPVCSAKAGNPPAQHIADESLEALLAAPKPAKQHDNEELDIEFYGDSEYNEEELPEGFDRY